MSLPPAPTAPPTADAFELDALRRELVGTPFAGKVRHFPSIDSTNMLAMREAEQGQESGTVYLADEQTVGRGRGTHEWHSAAGSGLYVSILLRPAIASADILWLSLATGLAVQAAVRDVTSLAPDIRWPNDLMLSGRKLGGILTELNAEVTRVRHAVIGIGINVHQPSFPPELASLATSLKIETGQDWSRQDLLVALLHHLHKEIERLTAPRNLEAATADIRERLIGGSTWVQGKPVIVTEADTFSGVTDGLDNRGFLRVRTAQGIRTVLSGGVREGEKLEMLLAIDVGNTNTVLGLYNPDSPDLIADWRITTHKNQTSDEYGVLFMSLFSMRQIDVSKITAIVVSSVVPPLDTTLRRLCERYFGLRPIFVEPGIKTGMPLLVDNPAELGADRIVNGVAAFARYGGPIIVVDFGTATTFDVISARGEYIGGVIAPGLGISADALFSRAAKLARVDIKRPARVIGTNTIAHLQSGLFYGYIGLVDGILERMLAEIHESHPNDPAPKVIATGGLAHMLHDDSKYITDIDDMLTLDGLRLLYERNRSSRSRGAAPPAATT